jgi:hypothetical protein
MRAMEGAAVLRKSVKQSCVENPSVPKDQDPQLVFGPVQLQRELKLRQITIRMDRFISCLLLRAAELVQPLDRPSENTTVSAILNTKVLWPLTRSVLNLI